MDVAAEQLVVRRHERRACKLAGTVCIAPEHARTVKLARTVGDGTGSIAATIVDVSIGGTGLETQVFIPRGTSVVVAVRIGPEGNLVEIPSRVQRVTMTSREPRYYLGLSYAGGPSERSGTLGLLIESVHAMPADEERR